MVLSSIGARKCSCLDKRVAVPKTTSPPALTKLSSFIILSLLLPFLPPLHSSSLPKLLKLHRTVLDHCDLPQDDFDTAFRPCRLAGRSHVKLPLPEPHITTAVVSPLLLNSLTLSIRLKPLANMMDSTGVQDSSRKPPHNPSPRTSAYQSIPHGINIDYNSTGSSDSSSGHCQRCSSRQEGRDDQLGKGMWNASQPLSSSGSLGRRA